MKIGFVLDDTLDTTDGIQQYILTLGKWFGSHGHEVHYLVGQTGRTDIPNIHSSSRNVKVRFNGNRMSMPLPADRKRLKALLDREQFDVLHVQVPFSPFMAGRVVALTPPHTAVIGTFHVAPHSAVSTAGSHVLSRMTARPLRRFDRIVSVSQAAADFARRTYRIETDVIPNAVDIASFRPPSKKLSAHHMRAGAIPTIIFVGRLVPRKGCGVLLEAVNRLRRDHPDLRFKVRICGKGPLLPKLQAYTNAHGLNEIVRFEGWVSEQRKARLLQRADLAVFPSSGGESFGIVLVEAMAADGPVVLGADNPGYRSVLSPYPDVLFPVGDAKLLAVKIHSYLTSPAKREAALAWQQSYVGQFNTPVVAARLLKIYQAIETRRPS